MVYLNLYKYYKNSRCQDIIAIVPKLRSLRIKKVGNFSDMKFDFTDRINVIIGKIGIGKTTVLNSILFAMNGLLSSCPGIQPESEIHLKLCSKDILIHGEKMREIEEFFVEEEVVEFSKYKNPVKKTLLSACDLEYLAISKLLDCAAMHDNGSCLIIDDLPARLNREKIKKIMERLSKTKSQVLITSSEEYICDLIPEESFKKFVIV